MSCLQDPEDSLQAIIERDAVWVEWVESGPREDGIPTHGMSRPARDRHLLLGLINRLVVGSGYGTGRRRPTREERDRMRAKLESLLGSEADGAGSG